MKREDINVRREILDMNAGEVKMFPPVVKGSYIRNTCSQLKAEESVICRVNRVGDQIKVTRLK